MWYRFDLILSCAPQSVGLFVFILFCFLFILIKKLIINFL